MIPARALLISPAPLDAYPPVQHQARLLARAGLHCTVLTAPLSWSPEGGSFVEPGVDLVEHSLVGAGPLGAARRLAVFCRGVAQARLAAGSCTVEIAYDPNGMFYSDMAPFRPGCRIAHFHECLHEAEDLWLERRLRKAIRGYQNVVVADRERGALLQAQLDLPLAPTAVPNYPMLEARPQRSAAVDVFDVVYCGSLGLHQKLDAIIASTAYWPANTFFSIVGNDRTDLAKQLKRQAQQLGVADRVRFEGWLPYDALRSRLIRSQLAISLLDPTFEQWRTALGASNKRYQYMQAGLPQVGDMNPGVPEMLEAQGVGSCVRTFEPEEIARVVTRYAKDPDRCAAEGERGYELHLTTYNYERAFEPMLNWILAQVAATQVAA